MEKPKIDQDSLALELQELIQCPVCLGCLDDSVVVCQNGHGVCGECRSKLSQCPTCEAGFLPLKPTLLCQLLDKIPHPCPFADKGCPERMVTGDHKSFCQYRPADCKRHFCAWTGTLKDLFDHVRTSHKAKSVEREGLSCKCSIVLNSNKITDVAFYRPFILKKNFFWVWFHRDSQSKRMTYRFYHLPISKPTGNYYLIVSFKKGELEFKSVSKAFINMDNVVRAVDANDNGLIIPDDVIDMFHEENKTDEYLCTYEIITQ